MSKYEDYNSASRNYDNQRFAMGSDVMAAMIQFHCGKPLKDLHVLDAGCGTGNYAKALIDYGVGQVTLLDASPGMLEKAKVKLADAIESGKIKEVVEATMPPIPFPDASFDAVMFNLVLHHLDATGSGNFIKATQTLKEAVRILRPEGTVIISTCLPSTYTHAVWCAQLSMTLTERFNKIMPSVEQLDEMFEVCQLRCVQKMNILGSALVLHHIDTESSTEFPSVTHTLKEARRVTVSGGVILITTCLPTTISGDMWMTQLNMELSARFNRYNPSVEQFEKLFMAANISCVQKMNILGSSISKEYFNFEGPLDEAWRKTSSYWQLATETELEDIKRKITELKSKGELEKWARDHDNSDTAGVLTMFVCECK
ncbi:demethylmenaquinone methyltransferase-like isoform X1 [Mercenaria mercenaria]|uniref:demethylmenaquinone methyltransferase-like isoform X1 n=1 Tax=Mercenaria mercenaria TaxID=6596 RepID=UPI00234F1510|nr:demethylmenaquinone methyltransferase-like isoform X1 [Mercenaria mercenaria]XP_053380872.1 demethylmenaquinone methyltransferase-like isoform X1 [Mercenaria mercenaria]XP_053380873.1 demethylmenaquinone methyltransferase-like isoform X1 [Mercenaria mercenaria]